MSALLRCCPWPCLPKAHAPAKLPPRESLPALEGGHYIQTLSLLEGNVTVLEREREKAQGESCSLTSKLLPAGEDDKASALQKTCALAASNSSSASASPLLPGETGACTDAPLEPAHAKKNGHAALPHHQAADAAPTSGARPVDGHEHTPEGGLVIETEVCLLPPPPPPIRSTSDPKSSARQGSPPPPLVGMPPPAPLPAAALAEEHAIAIAPAEMVVSPAVPPGRVLSSPGRLSHSEASACREEVSTTLPRVLSTPTLSSPLPALSELATNKNTAAAYSWALPLFTRIASNDPTTVRDRGSGNSGVPLFVVAGACPNPFCGMQAVVYVLMGGTRPQLDFWWIKPMASNKDALEPQTLDRHIKGEHKNDPGRSRALYEQFADLFAVGDDPAAAERSQKAGGGLLSFEVRSEGGSSRALILSGTDRYFIYLIWQEDWTSNPFARSKYIKGKLVYQRDPSEGRYYARPYAYRDGVLAIPPGAELEQEIPSLMPPNSIGKWCLAD